MARDPIDIQGLLSANEDFAEAVARGEKWAVDHISKSMQFNGGNAYAFERQFDGKPRKWCGGCPHPSGCVMCTLPEPKGKITSFKED